MTKFLNLSREWIDDFNRVVTERGTNQPPSFRIHREVVEAPANLGHRELLFQLKRQNAPSCAG